MSEKEKEIIETLVAAIPDMSEFDKGYLLGKSEFKLLNQLRSGVLD